MPMIYLKRRRKGRKIKAMPVTTPKDVLQRRGFCLSFSLPSEELVQDGEGWRGGGLDRCNLL